jgi:hypothetical protein
MAFETVITFVILILIVSPLAGGLIGRFGKDPAGNAVEGASVGCVAGVVISIILIVISIVMARYNHR